MNHANLLGNLFNRNNDNMYCSYIIKKYIGSLVYSWETKNVIYIFVGFFFVNSNIFRDVHSELIWVRSYD